jgi:hypothetical protein
LLLGVLSDTKPGVAESTTAKRKTKRAGAGRGAKAGAGGELALRLQSDPREERRYEPKSSTASHLALAALWFGAGLAGAGVFGQFLRAEDKGPLAWAGYLIAAGAALVLGALLFGPKAVRPIRVGDAGVALEKDGGELERIGWNEVSGVLLTSDMLTFQAAGRALAIPRAEHHDAAARALAEARARIPQKLEGLDTAGLEGPADDTAGEVLALEPPQVAGLRCKASGKLVSFEKDARLCGYCGELYHKDAVPQRCATCDAKLSA